MPPGPDRTAADARSFEHPLLQGFVAYRDFLAGAAWPEAQALTAALGGGADEHSRRLRFIAQDADLLADGLHYEQRIAAKGVIATRERNWHDLFNALVWLRHPHIKLALNARQVADIAEVGPKVRTRGQCAMTQFDEAGAIVWCADPALVALWDAHDWSALFLRERDAWGSRIAVTVFGHALLERQFAGSPALSTAKTIAVLVDASEIAARCSGEGAVVPHWAQAEERIAQAIRTSVLLRDPQHSRPLPLVGISGWHADGASPAFYREAPCFRPLRPGRVYPPPLQLA